MITLEEFLDRVLKLGADRGPRGFPKRLRDRQILIKSILLRLDSGRSYTEAEINEALFRWSSEVAPKIHTDHVTIRRLLIDTGYLERTADGRAYRVGFPMSAPAFALDVDEVDLAPVVAAYLDEDARRRALRGKKHGQ